MGENRKQQKTFHKFKLLVWCFRSQIFEESNLRESKGNLNIQTFSIWSIKKEFDIFNQSNKRCKKILNSYTRRQTFKINFVFKKTKLVLNLLIVRYVYWGYITNMILIDVTHRQRI